MRAGTRLAAWPVRWLVICASGSESVSNRGRIVILVVEDDPHVARLVELVLQRSGRDCQVVADGAVAFHRARETRPQMIFADLAILGMNGEALCSALKG